MLLPLIFFACGGEPERVVPEVNPDSISLEVLRFEQDLMEGDTSEVAALLDELIADYPDFTAVYFRYAIP